MDLLGFVVILVLVGVLMWVINGPVSPYIWPQALKVINIIVLVVMVMWAVSFLLNFFGLWAHIGTGSPFRHN